MNEFAEFEAPRGAAFFVTEAGNSDKRRRICLISRAASTVLGLDGVEAAHCLDSIDDLSAAVRLLSSRRSGWGVVIVNLDDFAEDARTIDLLRRLRMRAPNVPVILLSRRFGADDLTQERLAITDVSLVIPLGEPDRLADAIQAARANNMAWRRRRRSLLLEKARQLH